jgi:hypothetical protein
MFYEINSRKQKQKQKQKQILVAGQSIVFDYLGPVPYNLLRL